MIDISVLVSAHEEGPILKSTLRSIQNASARTIEAGLSVEIIGVFDSADRVTLDCARTVDMEVIQVAFGNLADSRNFALKRARGKYIAIVDGDDLWSSCWLEYAYNAAVMDSRRIVWHPELNLYFGDTLRVFRHTDMEVGDFDIFSTSGHNPWTSACFTTREILLEIPYPQLRIDDQIGFEDWGWNLAAIESGCLHKVVQGTAHAIRAKNGSLSSITANANCLPKPTRLYNRLRDSAPVPFD